MYDTKCIFCQIAQHQAEAQILLETEHTLACLSIEPAEIGHTLVIPKIHEGKFYQLDSESYRELMQVSQQIAKALERFSNLKVGLTIQGFSNHHTHIHLIPMHTPHSLNHTREPTAQAELTPIAQQIRHHLQGV